MAEILTLKIIISPDLIITEKKYFYTERIAIIIIIIQLNLLYSQFQFLAPFLLLHSPCHFSGSSCCGDRGAKAGHQHTRSFVWERCDDACIFLTPGSTWDLFYGFYVCQQTFILSSSSLVCNPDDVQIC